MVDYDAVVIGSGAGGLTAAVALAQAGKRVLVLEQHYVPGGWCHSFQLEGYHFSPGVHYIGELGPGGRMRRIYEGLGVAGDMTFLELNPDGYDRVIVGQERFDIPKGYESYLERLVARFPKERQGIRNYLSLVRRTAQSIGSVLHRPSAKDMLLAPFRLGSLARNALAPLSKVMGRYVNDPLLKTILASQVGDHGLAPSRAPFAVHAAVADHYFNGGYYPKGGGQSIPRAFLRALKRAGGEIRLSSEVSQILVEGSGRNKRAIGVRLATGEEVRAHEVISNADPNMTFSRLFSPDQLSGRLRRRLAKTRYSMTALSLFLAVDMDVKAAGLDSSNVWYYGKPDVDAAYGMRDINQAPYPGAFLTTTTLKDPSKFKGHHTMESFVLVPYDAFAKWSNTRFEARPESYETLKAQLTQNILRTLDRFVPGLSERVVFSSLGTPLTNAHYVFATQGNLYGTEKTRDQVGPFSYPLGTEFKGLTLCGASTLGHGVMGATFSGLAAARKVLGGRVSDLLRGGPELTIYPCDDVAQWPEKIRKRIEERSQAADTEAA